LNILKHAQGGAVFCGHSVAWRCTADSSMLLDRRSWSRVHRTWFLCFIWCSRLFQL